MLDQLFNYNDHAVRVCGDPDNPLFVAKDVCAILGLENNRRALSTLDDDEKASVTLSDTSNSSRKSITMNAVNEYGLYSLIFKSQKAEAKKFQRWVTSEVLPQIRKTGSYQASAPTIEEQLANPDLLISLATEVKKLRADSEHHERRAEALAPVAQFGQELLDTDDLYTMTQVSKPLGTSAVTMNRFLHECGIIWRHKDEWWPQHKYQNSGHFRVIAHKRSYEDGLSGEQINRVYHQIKVTAKGRELIHRKWREAAHNTPAGALKVLTSAR